MSWAIVTIYKNIIDFLLINQFQKDHGIIKMRTI